jgi:hypothetical protein
MDLGSTQPLTEMSTKNISGSKARPARKADNLTAICEPILHKMWELDISRPYGPPRPVTRVALPLPSLICGLFNDSVSSAEYRAYSVVMLAMDDYLRNWKVCEWKRSSLIWDNTPTFDWMDWGKPWNTCQECQSPGWDLNPRPSEYLAGVPSARPRCSMPLSRSLVLHYTYIHWILRKLRNITNDTEVVLVQASSVLLPIGQHNEQATSVPRLREEVKGCSILGTPG